MEVFVSEKCKRKTEGNPDPFLAGKSSRVTEDGFAKKAWQEAVIFANCSAKLLLFSPFHSGVQWAPCAGTCFLDNDTRYTKL